MLGAFANVEPAGAAQAIDKMLHGAISDLARRRAISAAAGEVFVLPVGRSGLAPRLVVFAGLGHFGRYGPDVQRLAAANVTRTLALAGIENFAMVLWGTASGAEPADAARAQLEGVLTALADLAPEQRLKRITIVSRDVERLAAARRVAEDLLRLHPAAPLMRIARAAQARAQGGAPAEGDRDAARLALRAGVGGDAARRAPRPRAQGDGARRKPPARPAPARARALAPRAGHVGRRPRGVRRAPRGPPAAARDRRGAALR